MSSDFYYDANIEFDQKLNKEMVFLITRVEQGNTTLKQYLNKTDTIIPDDISQIREFKAEIVLYNSGNSIRKDIGVNTAYAEDSKLLKISVRCKQAFKIFIYTTHEMRGNQTQYNLEKYFKKNYYQK